MRALWLGILNAALPGLGYVFISGREVFGWLLIVATASALLARHWGFTALNLAHDSALAVGFQMLSIAISSIAFGYDAYRSAKNLYAE